MISRHISFAHIETVKQIMNKIDTGKRTTVMILTGSLLFSVVLTAWAFEDPRGEGTPMMGIPLSAFASREVIKDDVCPEGTKVIVAFMAAWAVEDYTAMYSLLDGTELDGYTIDEAKIDFRFMEYKPYMISSVRRSGDDFEFLLSYGEWRDGDKEIKKIVISGKTFKIVLQKNRSVFKSSLASYF